MNAISTPEKTIEALAPTRMIDPAAVPGRAPDDKQPFGDLPPPSDESDAAFARIEALVKARAPATGIGAIGQAVTKGLVAALDAQGLVDSFEVVSVAKDPTRPIVYYIVKGGKVIATELTKVGLRAFPQILGYSLNFFDNFGPLALKPNVALVLPNGDCILLLGN